MDCKNIKKKFFSPWLFEIIHIIRFEIWDLRSRDLQIFLGYDIIYLSIWPFMRHPWFPTRKASKLIFVCFQLAGEWHHPAIWKQSHGHHPASLKQVNLSFEAFLVGNQGWPIKGQMLRNLISYPKNIFRSLDLRSQISKRIMWIISKSHREKIFFLIFLQSIHQVDMKIVVKWA